MIAAGGKVLITDGPHLERAHRRLWILECASLDEALAWGRKARRRVARAR